MKIFITGGTGFIGSHLVRFLTAKGHKLTILSRSARSSRSGHIATVGGDPTRPGPWQEIMKECDAVVNLAGSAVFCRWTRKNRREIMDSRVLATRNIAAALRDRNSRVKVLVSGSAVGYYGDKGDLAIHEGTPAGADFLARVAENWETEALVAGESVRVVHCRLGVVLGPNGGVLAKMAPPFKAGLGAVLGSGKQWFSWIHIDDLVEAFNFILENEDVAGPVNLTSPKPATNREFSRLLADSLGKPLFLPAVPGLLLKLIMGETANLVLDSARVSPAVLLGKQFVFRFSDLSTALHDLLS
ncbi:MAG: TIGR01777 family oxidoreductase [Desulfurivibrionaceae bacterium]|nr:TIGR01777 family oxidoreductase [Desulfurivibrionaceae bacterium]